MCCGSRCEAATPTSHPVVFERPHHQRIAHVLAALDGDKPDVGRGGCPPERRARRCSQRALKEARCCGCLSLAGCVEGTLEQVVDSKAPCPTRQVLAIETVTLAQQDTEHVAPLLV